MLPTTGAPTLPLAPAGGLEAGNGATRPVGVRSQSARTGDLLPGPRAGGNGWDDEEWRTLKTVDQQPIGCEADLSRKASRETPAVGPNQEPH